MIIKDKVFEGTWKNNVFVKGKEKVESNEERNIFTMFQENIL